MSPRGSTPAEHAETSIDLVALGVAVRLVEVPVGLAEALRRAWSWCLAESPGEPEAVLSLDPFGHAPMELAMEQITQAVTVEAVTRRAGTLLMLHACVLADPDSGDAVALVGPSGMGKTTAARVLGRRWTYLSDETAGIHADGSVVPYPKPLSVAARVHRGKDQVSPASLGLIPSQRPARLRAVLLLDRRPEADDVVVSEVPTVRAVAMLAEHTSFLSALDRPLHRMAEVLRGAGGLRRVTYAEAAHLAEIIDPLVKGEW